ncbi:MAG: DUF4398 domain-containing protein [Deltaproteobacteria bacterium]|nr:DUF4398 domain-containing protein [Deltaproteobacteria bacterium]
MLAHRSVPLRSWIAGALLLGSACGPIRSQSVLIDAASELTAAEVAGGQKHSPYEYVAAEWYLRKAREEQSYADFEAAQHLAEKARSCAKLARKVGELFTRAELSGAERPVVEKRGCRAGGSWRVDERIEDPIVEPTEAPTPKKKSLEPKDPEPTDPAPTNPPPKVVPRPSRPGEPADPDEEAPADPRKKKKPAPPVEPPPPEDLPPGEEPQEGAI